MIKRGCGRRIRGGIYVETAVSLQGTKPLNNYILCPPRTVNLTALGLSPRGAKLIEVNGVWHIFDVVGTQYYRVADYVEETRQKGASRRLSSKLDFSKLTEDSLLVLIHAQAIIENFDEYAQPPLVVCPKDKHDTVLDEPCAGLWWHDFSPASLNGNLRSVKGGVTYTATSRPDGVKPSYQYGIFMTLPISNLAVIRGGTESERTDAERNFEAARFSGLPVFMEDE